MDFGGWFFFRDVYLRLDTKVRTPLLEISTESKISPSTVAAAAADALLPKHYTDLSSR